MKFRAFQKPFHYPSKTQAFYVPGNFKGLGKRPNVCASVTSRPSCMCVKAVERRTIGVVCASMVSCRSISCVFMLLDSTLYRLEKNSDSAGQLCRHCNTKVRAAQPLSSRELAGLDEVSRPRFLRGGIFFCACSEDKK